MIHSSDRLYKDLMVYSYRITDALVVHLSSSSFLVPRLQPVGQPDLISLRGFLFAPANI